MKGGRVACDRDPFVFKKMLEFLLDETMIVTDEADPQLIQEFHFWGIEANKIRMQRVFKSMPEFHGPKADMMALVWKAIDVEKIEVDEDYKFYKS